MQIDMECDGPVTINWEYPNNKEKILLKDVTKISEMPIIDDDIILKRCAVNDPEKRRKSKIKIPTTASIDNSISYDDDNDDNKDNNDKVNDKEDESSEEGEEGEEEEEDDDDIEDNNIKDKNNNEINKKEKKA